MGLGSGIDWLPSLVADALDFLVDFAEFAVDDFAVDHVVLLRGAELVVSGEVAWDCQLGSVQDAAAAGVAIGVSLQIQPVDGGARSHGAAPIVAVSQTVGVAEFMESLFRQAIQRESGFGRQAVELLAEAERGDQSGTAGELGFAEDEGEDGNIKIDRGDSEKPRAIGLGRQLAKDRGRVVLVADWVEGEAGVEGGIANVYGVAECGGDAGSEFVEGLRGGGAHSHQVDHLIP